MNEIAKCPVCGKEPGTSGRIIYGVDVVKNVACCNAWFGDPDEWNQYAALRAENERLKGEVAFFDNRCPRCNSTLGLLHESECPLCRSRAEVGRLKGEVERLREIAEGLVSDLFYQIDARHGPKLASEYPSIVKARAALSRS